MNTFLHALLIVLTWLHRAAVTLGLMLVAWAVIVLGTTFVCAPANAAQPANDFDVRMLLMEDGWHGYQDGQTQAFVPSITYSRPWVRVWERSAINNQWGDWVYMMLLVNCDEWAAIPFATIDGDGYAVLMGDVLGHDPRPQRPARGEPLHTRITALCSQFGYQPPHLRPAPTSGFNYVER